MKPVLPEIAEKVEATLQCETITWKNIQQKYLGHKIKTFKPIITRITEESINAMKLEKTGVSDDK